jgi:hypothetical protein
MPLWLFELNGQKGIGKFHILDLLLVLQGATADSDSMLTEIHIGTDYL